MRGYLQTFAGVLLAGTVLAACSYVPDSVNPTTWKWSRLNPATWFESDTPAPPKPAQARSTLSERPASKSGDRPFPSVNDTPGKPAAPSSAERRNIAQGLQADRDNARYTDEVLRAQSSQAAPPPPAQPSTAVAAAPAPSQPPAAPVSPVTRQASAPPPASPPAQMQAAAPSPPPFTTPQPVQPAAPAAAVPVPSLTGATPAPVGRAAAVPVPSATPGGPTPSPLTAPVSASPVPPGVPTPRQTVQASEPLPPSAAPYSPPPASSAAPYSPPPSQTASALPSRPGAQVSPGGPAALPSGFVPGGGRTPLLAAVYAQSIAAQNARSISDIPPGFQQPTAQPIGQFATDVPQIVQQSFNTAIGQMPPAMTPNGQPARGGSVGAALIHFDEGATRVSAKTRDLLVGVVQQQREMGGRLRVVGHANGAGTREGARRPADVSLARAQSVSRELARLGVPSSAITTEALGDSRPIFDESTAAGAAENRRVEIYLEP